METAKDKKPNLSPISQTNRADKNNIIMNPEESEILYKKNAHLLSRLLKEGRENIRLSTKLSLLNKEKSHLGDKNTVLNSKYKGLKDQISLFARQHRQFNYQSVKLKKELEQLKNLKTKEEPLAQDLVKPQKLYLLEKKEQVYKKQIQTLQNLCQKKDKDKQKQLKGQKKDYDRNFFILEQKTKELYQKLSEERLKKLPNSPFKMKKIKAVNKKLNEKINLLEQSIKQKNLLCDKLVKQKQGLKIKHDHEILKHQKDTKQQFNELKQKEENLKKTHKIEVNALAQKLRSGFYDQLNLFYKERDLLKFQCESLKKALSCGKLGFDQAMLNFKKKYSKLYKECENQTKTIKLKDNKINNLQEQLKQLNDRFKQDNQQFDKKQQEHISILKGELKAAKDYNQDLQVKINDLKKVSQNDFLQQKTKIQDQVKHFKLNQNKKILTIEENHKKELEQLKLSYENRITNIESKLKNQMQHVKIEMENDLCSEKKRYEVFKNLKDKQTKELEDGFLRLQDKNQELKSKKLVLEQSLIDTKQKLNKYLSQSEKQSQQNKNLKTLWQKLNQDNETKDQQIQSLQKLNRSLSLSLNQKTGELAKNKDFNFTVDKVQSGLQDVDDKTQSGLQGVDDKTQSSSHVLADIHFD